jgi:hypothetical protein
MVEAPKGRSSQVRRVLHLDRTERFLAGMVCREEITLIAEVLILLFSENDKADQ